MSSSSRQSLRDLHLQQTRALIIEAFAECLEENLSEDVSVADIAKRIDVSERTVYRHFPTRNDLITALHDWALSNYGPLIAVPRIEDLPGVFRQVVQRFEKRPGYTRGLVHTSIGRDLSASMAVDVRGQIRKAIDESFPHASEHDKHRLNAIMGYLDSAHAWVVLHDHFGLSTDDVADVIGWAMSLVIADAHATLQTSAAPREPEDRTD